LLALLLCLAPHLLWKVAARPSPWPRRFLGLAARAVGARVSTQGSPASGDIFLIANHVSWIDILALAGASGAAFVAHDGIAGWPVIGWLARQNHSLFVSRDRRGALAGQLEGLREALAGHQPVTIFPEGTTGDGVTLLPFKPALMAVLVAPPRPMTIQPVHIDYGAAAPEIAWHGDEPAWANVKRLLARKGGLPVTIRFLSPFDPAACADRKAIAAQARETIAASIAAHSPSSTPSVPV
jgi:1-acyl-sn-glycerol-3-phosphate acyltransferase